MQIGLEGRKALITGGGTGIGRSVALAFAAAGADVFIGGRREEPLAETAALHAKSKSDEAHAIHWKTCDVGELEDVRALVDEATRTLGRIDILVQSAGINVVDRSMARTSPEDWERVLRINATGAFYVVREVLPQMRERGDGLVILISSIAGRRAIPLGGVAYNASKFAMSALGISAGYEEREHGIRFTNVYPGEVDTPILERRPVPVSAEHRARILQPQDVANLVLAVASLPPRAHVPELVITPTVHPWA